MFTLSQQLAEEKDNDDDIQEFTEYIGGWNVYFY